MTMDNLHDMFFGPLDKSYCNLFLLFSIVALIMIFLTSVGIISQLLFGNKKSFTPVAWMYALIGPVFVYIQNRLLYGMCKN